MTSIIISLQVTIILAAYFIVDYLDRKEKEREKANINRSVVFWVHLESLGEKHHKIAHFKQDKTASDFLTWVQETINEFHTDVVVVNCGIIR